MKYTDKPYRMTYNPPNEKLHAVIRGLAITFLVILAGVVVSALLGLLARMVQ